MLTRSKYVHQLLNSDFEKSVVWEYLKSDEIEDGLLIAPFIAKRPGELRSRLESAAVFETFFMKTVFVTSNNRELEGFCKVTNHTSKFILQAFELVILYENRHIRLWYGMHLPDRATLKDIYIYLRINPGNLFPLKMRIVPDVFHIENKGIIDGFYGLDENMQYKKITLPFSE